MGNQFDKIINDVADYYTDKVNHFGATPQGVDWNGQESQLLRFDQLAKIIIKNDCKSFSVNDLGCGYGALVEYLTNQYKGFEYTGFDISEEMIKVASERYKLMKRIGFCVGDMPKKIADYSIASGIFNVRLSHASEYWNKYIKNTLDILDKYSAKGFAFNCLTAYSDLEKMRDNLYYADPLELFDFCKKKYSRNIALLHDYNLYEFTILVRKNYA